ncbi:MAG: ABC transporter ATP-binding protein [Thiomicrorhabdus chilensis]|uniref:ABC transporter ATP-binding protein n=1 Tax=Thiomicrorhabdus chilensis TaxID=63656 RepID=UPI00299F09C8|nr:ABC transporter ATP-binding protein [Thiomicrorhabdus chilensis]MDX1347131.1 ABC transporter ATP-binding protein [Thiomicrorhabdus chilensis]
MLAVKDLSISLGERPILENFVMDMPQGEIVAILGQSGSGKTTVLRAIAGLQCAQSGEVHLNQACVLCEGRCLVPPQKRGIGMVFQDYALFPHMTVQQNITFGIADWSKKEQQNRLSELLDLVRLPQEMAKRYPHELSGGQQQRVALARALAPRPGLILLDEPFSSLDSSTRYPLVLEMKSVLKSEGVSAILVTHDPKEAELMADRIGLLEAGVIENWQQLH